MMAGRVKKVDDGEDQKRIAEHANQKNDHSHVMEYDPPCLEGLPRVTLEIRGDFGRNYYCGHINTSRHLSFARQYAKADRSPLQFVFINLKTRRSDWGPCNILVLTIHGELLGALYVVKDGSGYIKIDHKKNLGTDKLVIIDDPSYVFNVHSQEYYEGDSDEDEDDISEVHSTARSSSLTEGSAELEKIEGNAEQETEQETEQATEQDDDDDFGQASKIKLTGSSLKLCPNIQDGAGLKISVLLSTIRKKKSHEVDKDLEVFFDLIRKVRVNAKIGQRYMFNMMVQTQTSKPRVNFLVVRDRNLGKSLKTQVEALEKQVAEQAAEIENMKSIAAETNKRFVEEQQEREKQQSTEFEEARKKQIAEIEEKLIAEQVKQRLQFEAELKEITSKLENGAKREVSLSQKIHDKKAQINVLKKEVLRLREDITMEKKNSSIQEESLRISRIDISKNKEALSEIQAKYNELRESSAAKLVEEVEHAKAEAKIEADATLELTVSRVRDEEKAHWEKELKLAVEAALSNAASEKEAALASAALEAHEALTKVQIRHRNVLDAAVKHGDRGKGGQLEAEDTKRLLQDTEVSTLDSNADPSPAVLARLASKEREVSLLEQRCRALEDKLTASEKQMAVRIQKVQATANETIADISEKLRKLLVINEEHRNTNKRLKKRFNETQSNLIYAQEVISQQAKKLEELNPTKAESKGNQSMPASSPAVRKNTGFFSGFMETLSGLGTSSPKGGSKTLQPNHGQPPYNAKSVAIEAHNRKDWKGSWDTVRMKGTDGRTYKIGKINAAHGEQFKWLLDQVTNEKGGDEENTHSEAAAIAKDSETENLEEEGTSSKEDVSAGISMNAEDNEKK